MRRDEMRRVKMSIFQGIISSTHKGAGFYLPKLGILPEYEELLNTYKDFDLLPLSMEVELKNLDISLLYEKLKLNKTSCLLESLSGKENGRYSFIATEPLLISESYIQDLYSEKNLEIRNIISSMNVPLLNLPFFYGGLIGYWTYEMALPYQGIKAPEQKYSLPCQRFFLPQKVIVYDSFSGRLLFFFWFNAEDLNIKNYNLACQEIKNILSLAKEQSNNVINNISTSSRKDDEKVDQKFQVNIAAEVYCQKVEQIKERIRKGDAFQVVLSRRWKRKSSAKPWNVYRKLRKLNPSPYMFYFSMEDSVLMGASPEMQVKVEGDIVKTRPIAGTRKLTGDLLLDEKLKKELQEDEKEKAEHLMLVDLGRNDIGKISEAASVELTEFQQVEAYSHVFHLVSQVEGKLKKGLDALDAFYSILPAGTLSGAPKRKAMEIILELENEPRGPYGGAVGYIGFDGNLDSCITIRSILYKHETYYMQAGAGVVADSIPEMEEKETRHKARVLMKAILEAEDEANDINDR